MSLDLDPLDGSDLGETQPAIPELPPDDGEPRASISRTAWLSSVPVGVWVMLGIVGVLMAVIVIIATAAIIRSGAQAAATPTPLPPPAGPTIGLLSSTTSPGAQVTVQGLGYQPNEPVTVYLRDPQRPTDPILQVARGSAANDGTLVLSFVYPLEVRWAALPRADVIVQSGLTGAYTYVPLNVTPQTGPVTPLPTPIGLGTRVPMATLTPFPTFAPPTPPPTFAPPTWTPLPPTWTPLPPTWTPVPPSPTPAITDWRGEYFNNNSLAGSPVVVRNDRDINFNWGRGSPDPAVPVDNFSVRWTRTLNFEGRLYRFSAQADDGVRVYVDDQIIIDEWHPASPLIYTRDVSLSAGPHTVRVEFYEGVFDAYIYFKIEAVNTFVGWKGEYFDNPFLGGPPKVIRDDVAVSFDWGGNSPAPGLPAQSWSARWTKSVQLAGGAYRFTVRVDDGVRLLVDGALVINEFHGATGQVYQGDVNVAAGNHTIVVEYYQNTGGSSIYLTYQPIADITGWRAEYYANDRWAGFPTLIRNEQRIDFSWGFDSPDPLIPADHFSARFTRSIDLQAGEYQFDILVDDGVRFYVDGLLVIDKVLEQAATRYSVRLTLTQGRHDFRIDYVEYTREARLAWSRTPLSVTVTPTPVQSPTPAATSAPSLPVIEQFDVVPNQTQQGGCVNLSWRVSGNVVFVRVLRNGGLFQDNAPFVGSTSDCLGTVGTYVYRLEAFNALNQSSTRDVNVNVNPGPATATPTAPPTINSFTVTPTTVTAGQCVQLQWSTSNATTPISVDLNGQTLQTNLAAGGSLQHCPTQPGQAVYSLIIAAGPNNAALSSSVIVTVQ
jgi:hypothetical protein